MNAIHLEISEISKRLHGRTHVIDIGCANGFSTLHYASHHDIDIKGIDYIPEMIDAANETLKEMAGRLKGLVRFEVGNLADLNEADGQYDAAIITRVIINLGERDRQIAAIREAARILKSGGVLLMSEATNEGWTKMNAFRAEWGLEPIPVPAFNLNIDEELARTAAPDLLDLEEISNFSSTYFVGTRVLKPLLARALGESVDPARPDMDWN